MNTKFIMTASAIILGTVGLIVTFTPDLILGYLHLEAGKTAVFLMQILGALYCGFAMLNWMTKTSLIGGIYNRPIAIANFAHFLIAGLAIVKGLISDPHLSIVIWTGGVIYFTLAISFGIILFRHPISVSK